MNIYFSPTEHNELKFPSINLSNSITTHIINTDTDIDQIEDRDLAIDDSFNKEDVEVSQFYKNYGSKKKLFQKTEPQKKLNKIKVYFIVKSKIVKGKEINYAVPIRDFNDLGNSILEKSTAFIAGFFYLKIDKTLYGLEYTEGSPGARPFRLDEVIHTEPPYDAEEEFTLEQFILPRKYKIDGDKLTLKKKLDLNNIDPNLVKETLEETLDEFGEVMSVSGVPSEYEYNYSMIDNTFLVNSSKYSTDLRQKASFNGQKVETGFLSRLKELNEKNGRFKYFNMLNIFSLVLGDVSSSIDKNIIPVFSNLEDAQDFLITILEEVHQPFQVRRKIENYSTSQLYTSLNYLDDSFSFQNDYFVPDQNSKGTIERFKNLLLKFGIINSPNLSDSKSDEFYHENKYQTKGPFFLEDTESRTDDFYVPMSQQPRSGPKNIWRERDYWSCIHDYFPGQPEAYSWWESRDMTTVDKGLLKKSQDIKVISMGLGDFLEFWNNPKKKNGDVLFIPSSTDLNKKKLPLTPKKSRDKFYDYQQKFRESKIQDTENYIYEIKLSVE